MSEFLGELGGITAGVGAEGLAFAAGFAASHALEPVAVTIKQDAWNGAPVLRLDPLIAADAAAQDITTLSTMQDEASYSGYDATRFQYLYESLLTAPGMGQLLTMLRRKTINTGNFEHGLQKARLEPMWTTPLEDLQNVYLSPAEVALGIVRSTIADPGLLVTTLDTSGSTIPKYPVYPGSALTEAAAGGVDEDRLRVMVGAVGLPMSPQQAASATFRNIINRQAFNLAILEGDIRPEYADAIFDQARQILSAEQYAELQLRGFLTAAERQADTALHGMSTADSDLLYDLLGRSIPVHQITTGEARGGTYNGDSSNIPEAYLSSLQRGNLRPEYYNLAYANRYTIPSYFVLRALLQAGTITEAQGEQYFLDLGWPPDLASAAAADYATTTTAPADADVKKAQTQLWTTTHRAYIAEEITDAEATTALGSAGVATGSVGSILNLWQAERGLVRKQLTPAQIKKAVTSGATNPATGAAWTTAEGLARLIALGFNANDANTFLEL